MISLPSAQRLIVAFFVSTCLVACEQREPDEACVFGETCSHYPRDFVVVTDDAQSEAIYGTAWGSDAVFSTKDNLFVSTYKAQSPDPTAESGYSETDGDGYKDLWGASNIEYASVGADTTHQAFFYATGSLENSLMVFKETFFETFAKKEHTTTNTPCDASYELCDEACRRNCYNQALNESIPIARVFRRSDFGQSSSSNVLSHPTDIVAWPRTDRIFLFVASRDGDQVSIFEHNLETQETTSDIDLRYVKSIETPGPNTLQLIDRNPADNQMELAVLGRNAVQACPDPAKLEAGDLQVADLREDFLSVYSVSLNDTTLNGPTKILEQRSSDCVDTELCTKNEALRGAWGLTLPHNQTDALLISNRCNNTVLEMSLTVSPDGDNTTQSIQADRTYSMDQTDIYEGCDVGPKNLGFKGVAATSDQVFVASWETGYILEWDRVNIAKTGDPNAHCVLGEGRCALRTCTAVNPNWYLRNESSANYSPEDSETVGSMRPFPYQIQVTDAHLFVSLDRNGLVLNCPRTSTTTTDSGTKTVADNLGLTTVSGFEDCTIVEQN